MIGAGFFDGGRGKAGVTSVFLNAFENDEEMIHRMTANGVMDGRSVFRELIVLDPRVDEKLKTLIQFARLYVSTKTGIYIYLSPITHSFIHSFLHSFTRSFVRSFVYLFIMVDVENRLRALMHVVVNCFCSSSNDKSVPVETEIRDMMSSKRSVPFNFIGDMLGVQNLCRHRSLIFKYLADDSVQNPHEWGKPGNNPPIRVGLLRGSVPAGAHMWCNTIHKNQIHIVELFGKDPTKGNLIPINSKEAKDYQPITPSLPVIKQLHPIRVV